MLSVLSFGKKRRTRRKVSRKGSKKSKSAKPPARLMRICRKYKIKATKKVGSRRVYKSIAVLKKACIKKVKAAMKADKKMAMRRRKSSFGSRKKPSMRSMAFGKRRAGGRGRKVSKAAAMKAFRQFYKRHCAGGRGSRFGNGGNPALGASMGYQFCPNGMGGVLGANSTGMFPSPCTSMAPAAAPMAFGRRRSTRRKTRKVCKTRKTRKSRKTRKTRKCRKVRKSRKSRKVRKSRKTRKTCKKSRRKTRKVYRKRRKVTAFGRLRRSAFGLRRFI